MTNAFCGVEVGDFIRAYHKGIHKVTKIQRRFKGQTEYDYYFSMKGGKYPGFDIGDEYSPLIHYITIVDGNMNIKKKPGKEQCCDAAFCKLVHYQDIYKEGNDLQRKYAAVSQFIHQSVIINRQMK